MGIQLTIDKGRVPVKVWTEDIEPEALQQLVNVSQLPIVHGHVAAMPDVHRRHRRHRRQRHPTKGAIIPAAVGVDIGCGMNAVRPALAREGPAGRSPRPQRHRGAVPSASPAPRRRATRARSARGGASPIALETHRGEAPGATKMQKDSTRRWIHQLGTLGGGNHFIEVCLDEAKRSG